MLIRLRGLDVPPCPALLSSVHWLPVVHEAGGIPWKVIVPSQVPLPLLPRPDVPPAFNLKIRRTRFIVGHDDILSASRCRGRIPRRF